MNRSLELRLSTLALLFSAGCVNIYVRFPEAAIENAADEIVDEVRPEDVSPMSETDDAPPAQAESSQKEGHQPAPETSGFIYSFFKPRHAFAETAQEKKEKFKINIATPAIKKIIETLKKRYPKLLPFYQKGALGEGRNGYLARRPMKGLSLKEKRDAQLLQKQENEDRRTLYTKIAEANGIDDEFVDEIGVTFSNEWQEKSKPGWWIQGKDGKWKKKPKPKKKASA